MSFFLDKPVSQSRLWDTLAGIIPLEPILPSTGSLQTDSVEQLANVCVLLVEDNEINQQIARELMESMGVQVTLADNGQQALDLLQAASDPLPWSVVLMDLQMPHMDGHEATRGAAAWWAKWPCSTTSAATPPAWPIPNARCSP